METIHDLVPKSLATVALRAPQDIIQEASERAKALKEMVEKYCGGTLVYSVLDRNKSEIEI